MSLRMPTTATATSAATEAAPEDSASAPTSKRARKSPEETMAELKAKRQARDEESAKALDSAGGAMSTAGSSLTSLSNTVGSLKGSSAAKSTLEGLDFSASPTPGGAPAAGAAPTASIPVAPAAPASLPSAPTTGAPSGGGSAGAIVGVVSAAFQLGGAALKAAAASKRSEGEDTAGMVTAGVNGALGATTSYVSGTQLDATTQNAYNAKVQPYNDAAAEVALCDKNTLQTQRLMDQGKMSPEEGKSTLAQLSTQRQEAFDRGERLAGHKPPKEKKAPKEKVPEAATQLPATDGPAVEDQSGAA